MDTFDTGYSSPVTRLNKQILDHFKKTYIQLDDGSQKRMLDYTVSEKRILFSIRFLNILHPGLRKSKYGYSFFGPESFACSGGDGWRRNEIDNVEWIDDEDFEYHVTRDVIFTLSEKLSMRKACTAIQNIITSLTGEKSSHLALNVVLSCKNPARFKIQFFDEEEQESKKSDAKENGEALKKDKSLKKNLQSIIESQDMISINIILPVHAAELSNRKLELTKRKHTNSMKELEDFIPSSWSEIEPWSEKMLETEVSYYNAFLIRAFIHHLVESQFDSLLELCNDLTYEIPLHLVDKDNVSYYGFSEPHKSMKNYVNEVICNFIKTVQLKAAIAKKAEFELLMDSSLTKPPKKKKSLKKIKKGKLHDSKADQTSPNLESKAQQPTFQIIKKEDIKNLTEEQINEIFPEDQFIEEEGCIKCKKKSTSTVYCYKHHYACEECKSKYPSSFQQNIKCTYCSMY
jgi:hypothetical protein